jgi:DNA polymerase I
VSHFHPRATSLTSPEKKAPSRYKAGDIEKLKGAEVGLNCVTGLHEGVGVIDYKGLYPSIILGGNLSYETQRDGPGENILQLENGTYWDQSKQGLLPSVVEYLFDYRDTCKQRMRDATTPEERAAWNTTQMAVKRVMASLYGMCAHIGYGWANGDIAHTITQEGRRCIRLLDSVATKYGYECLYGHTDSAFVKVPNVDEAHKLAEKITTAVQRETGNNMLFAELEAWMPYWLLTKKNRYVGKVAWPEEDQGKLKVAGFGMKASNTAPLSKKIQKGVFELICDGANENAVEEFVLPIAMQVRNGEIPLEEVSMKTRLGMHLKDYKVLSGASKAAAAYNKNNREKFGKGDSVPWTYVKEEPGIIAYREPEDLAGFTLDSDTILKKMLKTKLDSIYSTLSWDLERALGAPSPKAYGWW